VNRRLILGYLGVAVFVLLALELPLGVANQRNEHRTLTAKLEHDATTLASLAEDAIQTGRQRDLRAVARVVYDYSRKTQERVVVVDRNGAARIDTSARDVGAESFGSRPEIRRALQGLVTSGTRWSNTLHSRLLYVAVPIASGGVVHGAVRITYPTSAVDARVLRFWLLLAAIAAVVLAAAALVGRFTARHVTRPLRGLEVAAAAVGAGDLEARAPEDDGPGEVRSLARAFNETVSKLGALLRSQEEFVADASHELRTPLTALRLRIETGDLDGAGREATRLSELVESLLALARADAAPSDRVDVSAAVRERVETWQPLADERHVTLRADVDGAVHARVARARLTQAVDNLVSNALEVTPAGASIVLAVTATRGSVEVHVVDHGPGLTADERARAFDRFWRARPGGGGSGLGLAIVRKLVEADAGAVELREAAGGGIDAVIRLRRA
jgi:signal transduction histidine kinase